MNYTSKEQFVAALHEKLNNMTGYRTDDSSIDDLDWNSVRYWIKGVEEYTQNPLFTTVLTTVDFFVV